MNLLAHAVCPGELEISPAELAAAFSTTEAAVNRSLSGRSVRGTLRDPVELAREAAVECLGGAGVVAGELGAILWLGEQVDGLRLQDEIGATQAQLLCLAGECAEYLSAMVVARGLMRDPAGRILACTGEHFPVRLTDTAPTEQNYRNFLGDAGSALLVGRGEGPELLGYGFCTRGSDWRYLQQVQELQRGRGQPAELPFYGQVLRDSMDGVRLALERCLDDAGLELSQVDVFCFPSIRLPRQLAPLLRMLGIPPAKLVAHPAFAHMGRSDVLLDLEYVRAGGQAVRTVLIVSTSIGVVRCAVFQYRSQFIRVNSRPFAVQKHEYG